MHKLQKTAEIAGFDVSGSLPESEIKEIEAAKMKAKFPTKIPKPKEPEGENKVYVWDMIGKFKVKSVRGHIIRMMQLSLFSDCDLYSH